MFISKEKNTKWFLELGFIEIIYLSEIVMKYLWKFV